MRSPNTKSICRYGAFVVLAFVATGLFTFAAVSSAVAQDTDQANPSALLTDADVTGYAGAMVDLAKLAEEHRERWEEIASDFDTDDTESGVEALKIWSEFLHGSATRDDYLSIIKRHGFESEHDFQTKTERILTVYSAIKTDAAQPEMQQSLSQMMQRLEASGLSDDQKAEMKKAFEEAQGRLHEFQEGVSNRDRAVVERHLALIEETFEKLQSTGS